jgi:natural product precursor
MKLKVLKLNQLSNANLDNRHMNSVKGGSRCCVCGCAYADSGGSSSVDNNLANVAGGLQSPGGGTTNGVG